MTHHQTRQQLHRLPALTKVTISLGYIPNVQFAPFYLALDKGYYRDEGLDVTFKHGIVPDLIKLLGQGDEGVNFAVASGDELIAARVQGIPRRICDDMVQSISRGCRLRRGQRSHIEKPRRLEGAYSRRARPLWGDLYGPAGPAQSGGLKQSDINMKSIDFTQVASLSTGQVDAAMVYAANEPVQLRSQNMTVSTLLVSDYVKLASNGLATNDKTLKENPELVSKVVRATLKGVKDTTADPKAAFEIAVKQVPEITSATRDLQLQVLQETVKLMQPKAGDAAASQPLGWVDRDVWSSTQNFLLEAGIIPSKGNLDEMFTNDFVPK